jgi:hypothetical protein
VGHKIAGQLPGVQFQRTVDTAKKPISASEVFPPAVKNSYSFTSCLVHRCLAIISSAHAPRKPNKSTYQLELKLKKTSTSFYLILVSYSLSIPVIAIAVVWLVIDPAFFAIHRFVIFWFEWNLAFDPAFGANCLIGLN